MIGFAERAEPLPNALVDGTRTCRTLAERLSGPACRTLAEPLPNALVALAAAERLPNACRTLAERAEPLPNPCRTLALPNVPNPCRTP